MIFSMVVTLSVDVTFCRYENCIIYTRANFTDINHRKTQGGKRTSSVQGNDEAIAVTAAPECIPGRIGGG